MKHISYDRAADILRGIKTVSGDLPEDKDEVRCAFSMAIELLEDAEVELAKAKERWNKLG